jgi:exo-beta-1,3-glucanase (GH17 family)
MKRILSIILSATLLIALFPLMSQTAEPAAFTFTSIPARGDSNLFISGSVSGLTNTSDYRITAYIRVAGNRWGPKPASDAPFTAISTSGQFQLQYASYGQAGDLTADEIAVFLVPIGTSALAFDELQANHIIQALITRDNSGGIRVDGVDWRQTAPELSDEPERYADFDTIFPGVRKNVTDSARFSVNYSPFVAPYTVHGGAVPPESLVREHLTLLARNFDSVRFFTAQDSLLFMYEIARELGLNVIGTAWIDGGMSDTAIERQLDNLIELANSGRVTIASVGSEVLFRGTYETSKSSAEMLGYIEYVRAGITAPVPVTYMDESRFFNSHTDLAGLEELNAAVDLILYSHYPIFGGSHINNAAREVGNVYRSIANLHNKPVIIAETGWLPQSETWYGSAVPDAESARRYWEEVQEWARVENVDVFWFNAFDEEWKGFEGRLDARNWGIYYGDGTLKETFRFLDKTDEDKTDEADEPVTTPDSLSLRISAVNSDDNWLEISNPTDKALSAKGLSIARDYHEWRLPAVIVQPGEVVRVRGRDNDVCVVLKGLQADFNFEIYTFLVLDVLG